MFIDARGAPQMQAGKVNALAVAAPKRLAALPKVPTVPTIDPQAWQCIAAPRATPAAVVDRLNAAINKQLAIDEVRATLQRYGVEANPMSVAALNQFIAADAKRFADLVKVAGLKPS